jgi:uncharacterized membrane protein
MDPFRAAYGAMQLAILGLLFTLNVSQLLASLGWAVPVNRVTIIGMGALLVIIGNFVNYRPVNGTASEPS